MTKKPPPRKMQFRLHPDAALWFSCRVTESINAAPDNADSIWGELTRATSDFTHPWRTPALATRGGTVRTVVLRRVSEAGRELVFYTDARSPKVAQLSDDPVVEWLFYNPINGVQVRARARATVDSSNETTEAAWRDMPAANRLNYCSPQAPGTPLPEDHAEVAPNPPTSEAGYGNFAVVTTQVESFDWLLLAPSGNQRRLFDYNAAANEWKSEPLVP